MLRHLVPEGATLAVLGLGKLALYVVLPPLVVVVRALSVDLQSEPALRELRTLEDVAEFSRADLSGVDVPLLHPVLSLVVLLDVELQVVLGVKRLLADGAVVVAVGPSLPAESA